MKVFALSSGSYSDYRVNAIFRNEVDAKAVAETEGWYYDVEEYELYEETPVQRMLFTIHADRRRSAGREWTSEVESGWRLEERQRLVWPWDCTHPKNLRAKIIAKAGSAAKFDDLWFTVEGWDEEACRKVVFDTITRLKAIQEGVTDG